MKKRIIVIISLIIIVFSFIVYLLNNNQVEYSFIKDNIKYALKVDGSSVSSFPASGLYRVDIECKNATCTWLYDEWKLSISDIVGDVTCNINFVSISKSYFNNYITSLSGKTQGNGQVVNENGYRYEGKNPNNYVMFNGELWRIIGVFDSNSHGISGSTLVKIIREDSIGGLVWAKYNSYDWPTSTLYNLLNGSYLNGEDGTDSGYCYGYALSSTTIQSNCDYSLTGIKENSKNMIQNVTWYLGIYSSTTVDEAYAAERSDTVYSGKSTSTTGYVGLMYPSDYGYAVLASNCSRENTISDYFEQKCDENSWILKEASEWMISPSPSTKYNAASIWNSHFSGSVSYLQSLSVRPVLYLKSNVYVLDGDGSINDPYIIKM